jgi:predicted enzyme related to lactoylglutathione lyase
MNKIISWVEIPASNFNRAVEFYTAVLNIEYTLVEGKNEKMACFTSGEGAISQAPNFQPSKNGALVSFDAGSDLDSSLEKVTIMGGKVIRAKTKIDAEGRGYFATVLDSEGNQIGLYQH